MNLYKLSLEFKSPIITPLKGDTIFGHFCWSYRELFGNDELEKLLLEYDILPKVIFSDGFKMGYLPRPFYPLSKFNFNDEYKNLLINERKEIKKYQLIKSSEFYQKNLTQIMTNLLDFIYKNLNPETKKIDSDELYSNNSAIKKDITHNTINRQTGTTGNDMFAPYSTNASFYNDQNNKIDIYFLLKNSNILSPDIVLQCLENIGKFGYGADATIGMGKFEIIKDSLQIVNTPQIESNYYMNLSPVIGNDIDFNLSFYNTFTRFGRVGNIGTFRSNPFKQPIVTINTASVLHVSKYNTQFIGNGVKGTVKDDMKIVYQAYSILFPILIKSKNE